jgi:hypothetical protein
VRHVDDAHEAVGDGEAERGQQQDGTERDAREQQPGALAPGEAPLHFAQALLRGDAHVLVRVVHRFGEQRAAVGAVRFAQPPDRRKARRLVAALHLHRGGGELEQRLDLRVAFLLQRLPDERQHRGLGAAGQRLGRREAHCAIGGQQLEGRQRALDLAPQAVVGDHVFRALGHGGKLLPRHRVDGLAAFDDEHALDALLLDRLHLALGDGFQQRGGARVALGEQRGDGGAALLGVAESELLDRRLVDRRRLTGERKQQREQKASHT